MAKPPPLPKERRRHPRLELFAAVRVAVDDETLVLYARNVSLGGIALDATAEELEHFPPGSEHEVMLFDAADEKRPPVNLRGHVVRHDADGLALMWSSTTAAAAAGIGRLLGALKPRPPRDGAGGAASGS
jgi:hypothetical protein